MLTHLHDSKLVQNYHTEYFALINHYFNVTRRAVYVKYYNINTQNSTYEDNLSSTFDIYGISDINFDIYDLTPAYFIQAIQNRSSNVTDLKGQQMDGISSIVVYTIHRPKIHDVLTFYTPTEDSEIFRVVNINTPVNAIHAINSVNFFELELEYAPIKDTKALKMNKRYVYDISHQRYLEYKEYTNYISKLERYTNIITKLTPYFNEYKDYYSIGTLISIELNELMMLFKQDFNSDFKRIFEKFKYPFGYNDIIPQSLYTTLQSFPFSDLTIDTYKFYNTETSQIEEYYWRDKTLFQNETEELLSICYELWKEMIS